MDINIQDIQEDLGVYVIWQGQIWSKYLRVGQGEIKVRLTDHRNDPAITKNESFGLYVTWASVPQDKLDGVEAYLGKTLNPEIGERFPKVPPIQVNLPDKDTH